MTIFITCRNDDDDDDNGKLSALVLMANSLSSFPRAAHPFSGSKAPVAFNDTGPFAVHLRTISIPLFSNLSHHGQYALINTNMTIICA